MVPHFSTGPVSDAGFFFQAEDGIRCYKVTGVQTCALPIWADHAMSLAQLTEWCARRFGLHEVGRDPEDRMYDVPWLILNSERAEQVWGWRPATALADILDEIARHADTHP